MSGVKNIVIFASGGGSNAESIIAFADKGNYRVAAIFTNNPEAGVIQRAENHQLPCEVFSSSELKDGTVLTALTKYNADLIVLAGFLKLIPSEMVAAYPNKIVNIHPALLPKFGGKGMHGMNVHKAVKEAGEKESGPTIHFVNENYDEGDVIYQAKVELEANDTPEQIAAKVLKLEHEHYPQVIAKLLAK